MGGIGGEWNWRVCGIGGGWNWRVVLVYVIVLVCGVPYILVY